jgi:hypothetical protein
MHPLLIGGFRIASQIIIILTLVGEAIVSFKIGSHAISMAQGVPYLVAMAVAGLIGAVMWWYTNHKTQIKSASQTTAPPPTPKTPDGKLSREEFVARLARALGFQGIDEGAAANSIHMMQLNVIATAEFKMMFFSTVKPTVGELIDNLYRQYLRQDSK